jgi:deoxyribonuclease-4
MHNIIQELHTLEDIGITYRLETTGKETQFGNLDELIEISKQVKTCGICVDFSHIHARYNGSLKTYDDFSRILDKIGTNLGDDALKDMHIHISGINYGAKGEKNHLPFEESDFNYKDCMKALKQYRVAGCIVCESPILEIDAKLLKDYYYSL